MPFSPPPDTPFYGGSPTSPDAGHIMPTALHGVAYIIDPVFYRRQFIDAQRNTQDVSATPGESTLNPEGIWVRSGTDWRFGAGQPRYDGDDVNRARFFQSFGVDVWTQGQFSLLPATEVLYAEAATTITKMVVGPSDQLVICMEDGTVDVLTAGTPAPVTGLTVATINDATSDSTRVWLATDDGIWSFPFSTLIATKFTAANNDTWDSILLANGKLVGGHDAIFNEIDSAGAVTPVFTHTSAGFRWTVLAAHPQAIYAGGSLGSRSELFRFGVDTTTGALTEPIQSLFLPGGEIVTDMIHYVGVVLITTTRGVRLCAVDENGNLNYGRVIEVSAGSSTLYPKEDFIYFGWPQVASGWSGIGRLVPQRFGDVEGQVPAWATDLAYEAVGDVTAVAEHQGVVVFAVDGVGVIQPDATSIMEEGWLSTGIIDMDIPYTFQPVDVQIASLPLEGTVAVTYELWEGTEDDLGVYAAQGNLDSPLLAFPGLSVRGVNLTFTLTAADATTGPTIVSWLLRVAPQPQRIEQILLPILAQTQVSVDDDQTVIEQDPLTLWQRLRDLVIEGRVVIYQEGPTAYRVKVENVQVIPLKGWTDGFRFFECRLDTLLRVMGDSP